MYVSNYNGAGVGAGVGAGIGAGVGVDVGVGGGGNGGMICWTTLITLFSIIFLSK